MSALTRFANATAGVSVFFWWFFGYGFYFSQSRGRL